MRDFTSELYCKYTTDLSGCRYILEMHLSHVDMEYVRVVKPTKNKHKKCRTFLCECVRACMRAEELEIFCCFRHKIITVQTHSLFALILFL